MTALRAGCRYAGRLDLGGRGGPLRSDRELALGAVAQDGPALAAAAERLRSDHEFVQDAVMQDGPVVAAAAEQLRSDRAFELGTVTQTAQPW